MGMNEGLFAGLLGGLETITGDYAKTYKEEHEYRKKRSREQYDKAAEKYALMLGDDSLELISPDNVYKEGMTVPQVVALFKQRFKVKSYLDTTIASPEFVANQALINPLVREFLEYADPKTIMLGTLNDLQEQYIAQTKENNVAKRDELKFQQSQILKAQGELFSAVMKDPEIMNDPEIKDYFNAIGDKAGYEKVTYPNYVVKKLYAAGLGDMVNAARGVFGENLGTDSKWQPKGGTGGNTPTGDPRLKDPIIKKRYDDTIKQIGNVKPGSTKEKLILDDIQNEINEQTTPQTQQTVPSSKLAPPSIMETSNVGKRQGVINDLAAGGGATPQAPTVNPQEAMTKLSGLAQNYINSLKTKLPKIMELKNKGLLSRSM